MPSDPGDDRPAELTNLTKTMESKPAVGAEVALALSRDAVALNRQASDIAGLCRDIVMKTAKEIGGRKHVQVEGWTSIATTYGCIVTIVSVERVQPQPGMSGGIKAVAELRRMSDGAFLSRAEGFVGEDEPTWYGGRVTRWNKFKKKEEEVDMPKRPDYAIRAMAQTRAVSRVCRGPFSHVVVLIDTGLSTTPAEEVSGGDDIDMGDVGHGGKIEEEQQKQKEGGVNKNTGGTTQEASGTHQTPPATNKTVDVPRDVDPSLRDQFRDHKWEKVVIHLPFKNLQGKTLGEISDKQLAYLVNDWQPKPFGNKPVSDDDKLLRAACDVAGEESADRQR